ncbi:MAG: SIR2 family protein, partial [Byssovorax sp.]
PWDKGERLARLVRKERTLLVLDGVEPLQWGPGVQLGQLKDPALEALVKELGAQNKGLCLITSRIAVADLDGMEGERVRAEELGSLSPEAGAELLKTRGAKGTDEELRGASSEYKGHGLALTLLSGYIRKRHKGDIRQRAHIPLLEGEPAQRMMGIYERWFAGKPEIAVLRLLGLFDRPAPEDEIAALRAMPYVPGLTMFLKGLKGGAWNEAVTTLQDVGLLAAASDHDDRLDAHPLVREHFGAQLRQKRPDAWREGHRRLYVYLSEKAKPLPNTIEEMAPLYAAVVHGCLAGKHQEALEEVHLTRIRRANEAFSIHKLGAFGSEVAVLSAFFDPPWERLALALSEPAQAFVLNEAGFALRALGRLQDAAGLVRLSLEQHVAQQTWEGAAVNASNLSDLLQSLGQLSEALQQARKSVEFADMSGDAFHRISKRARLAAALHAIGIQEEAATLFEEAERMQKERQPNFPMLYSLQGFHYCDLLLDQGRDAEVQRRAAQTLKIDEGAHSLLSIAVDHISLGRAHTLAVQRGLADHLTEATTRLEQAVDGLRRAGQQDRLPLGLLARAALRVCTRDFPAARHDLDETLTLATRCGFRLHEADAHLGHARLALAEGHPTPAREHLAKARRIITETGYHRRDGELSELEATASTMVETAPPQAPPSVPPPAPAPRIARSMPTLPLFPQPILDAYRDRKLAVLFGSGLSIGVPGNFPRWSELPERLLDEAAKQSVWTPKQIQHKRDFFKDGYVSLSDMLAELDTLKTALGKARKYRAALTSIFMPQGAMFGDSHRALAELDVNVVLTTNYDHLFEAADPPPRRLPYTWLKADKALDDLQGGRSVLLKIHGTAEDDDSVVMTRTEYDKAAAHVPYQRAMSYLLQSYTFLLVGYGINDPLDLDLVFDLNAGAFGAAARTHYALMHKSVTATDRDRWQRDMNIQVVPYDDHGDLPAILRALAGTRRNPP